MKFFGLKRGLQGMKIQRIKDERLILKNLQNIRVAYVVQTLGILGILGYDYVTKGMEGMIKNPLWFLFIVTTIVLAFLSMNIRVDYESSKKSPERSLLFSVIVLTLICLAFGIFTALSEGFKVMNGVVIGGIIFICGLVPLLFLYGIRKKRND